MMVDEGTFQKMKRTVSECLGAVPIANEQPF